MNTLLQSLQKALKDVVVFQLLTCVQLFATPWTAALQVSLSLLSPGIWLRFMSLELVMPSNHLILCCPLLLLPSTFPSIRIFSSESALCIRWPKYWSFSISPSNEYLVLISFRISFRTALISLQSEGLSGVFSSTAIQKYRFFGAQPSFWSNSHICTPHSWK